MRSASTNDPHEFLFHCAHALQSCSVGYGLCGTQPDSRRLLLLADASDPRPPPAPTPGPGSRPLPFGAAAGGLLFHDPAVRLPYTEALSYCSASSYMGLAWSLAAVEDVLAMEVSRELREATVAMLAGAWGTGGGWGKGTGVLHMSLRSTLRSTGGCCSIGMQRLGTTDRKHQVARVRTLRHGLQLHIAWHMTLGRCELGWAM